MKDDPYMISEARLPRRTVLAGACLFASGAATVLRAGGGGGGGRDDEIGGGSRGSTVNIGNTPQQGKKLNVAYTQRNLSRIKRKDLETAIRANQTGHSVVVQGFNKSFSNDIFRLLNADAVFGFRLGVIFTVRDSLLRYISEISALNTRKKRRDRLAEAIRIEEKSLAKKQETLAGKERDGLVQDWDYATVNQQADLVAFLRRWRRSPAQGVVRN